MHADDSELLEDISFVQRDLENPGKLQASYRGKRFDGDGDWDRRGIVKCRGEWSLRWGEEGASGGRSGSGN